MRNPNKVGLFKDLYKEIIIRNPKKGRFFRVKVTFSIGLVREPLSLPGF